MTVSVPTRLSVCALLVCACTAAAAHSSQGSGSSSSDESADKSGEVEDGGDQIKAGGVQNKFWMPSYKGKNPLGRRKIGITTSEIERYYTSEEMPESGPARNRSGERRESRESGRSGESMPLLWSGDEPPANGSQGIDLSMASGGVSLDSESSPRNRTQGRKQRNKRPNKNLPKKQRSKSVTGGDRITSTKRDEIKANLNTPAASSSSGISTDTMASSDNRDVKGRKKQYIEKEITSQFFDEVGKATSNESKLTTDYYKRLVKAATDNTKKKLGYRKIYKTTRKPQTPTPEFIFVNMDSKRNSVEKQKSEDDIVFSTRHEQLGGVVQVPKRKPKSKAEKIEIQRVNKLARKFTGKLRHKKLGTNESATTHSEDSFTSACDYSAWSDVLFRNKTERTAFKRKPKLQRRGQGSFDRSEEGLVKWPGKQLKEKADKLRSKKGKREKKKSSDEKLKRKKKPSYDDDYNDYDDKKFEKKLRMRTKGEKNHAVKEVRNYLKKTDDRYGGRTGRDRRKDKQYGRGGDRDGDGKRRRDFKYDGKPWANEGGISDQSREGRGRDGSQDESEYQGRRGRWEGRDDRRGDRDVGRRGRGGRGRPDNRGGWDRGRDDRRGGSRGRRERWGDDRRGGGGGRRERWGDDRRGGGGGRRERWGDDRRGGGGGRRDRGRDYDRRDRGGRWDRGRGDRGRGGGRGGGRGRGRRG